MPKLKELYPLLPVVNTIEGITLREIEQEGSSQHVHQGYDPHTWMSPMLVKVQAANIRDGLIKIDPEGRSVYEAGYRAFAEDLDALHMHIATVLAPVRGDRFFVYHPSFGYFADEFGLKQIPVETGGKSPSAKQLADVIDEAKRDGVKVIFVQPQFDSKSARTVANAIGGVVVTIDALARDYLTNMEDLARKIEKGLKGER